MVCQRFSIGRWAAFRPVPYILQVAIVSHVVLGKYAQQLRGDSTQGETALANSRRHDWHTPELLALAAKLPPSATAPDHQKLVDTASRTSISKFLKSIVSFIRIFASRQTP